MRRHSVARWLYVLFLAWALFALALETWRVVARNRNQWFVEWEVTNWRPGAPPHRRLEWFLREAEAHVPAGARVGFTSVLDRRSDANALSLYLWAAHLWPDRTLRPLGPEGDEAVLDDVTHWVAYNTAIDHPRARLVYQHPGGWVYEVEP